MKNIKKLIPHFERRPGEIQKLFTVWNIADEIGYGNCIQYLQHKWAQLLIDKNGLSAETAALAAGMSEYELAAFVAGRRM